MSGSLEIVASLFLLAGSAFALIGALGLAKLPDFFTRLHGPSKATTLGLGGVLIASAIYSATTADGFSFRPVLISLFLFLTAPVSANLLARAALARRVSSLAAFPEDRQPKPSDKNTGAEDA